MTRGEAIEILKTSTMKDTLSDQWQEAYKMAIQALSQEPKYRMAYDYADGKIKKYVWDNGWTEIEQEPCDDAVSREAVIEAVSEGCQELRGVYGRCEELINELPSVTQKPIECDDAISRESVDRILRDMGVNCAYDMPSFWANKGKDYKVIPTKWHKGYQQAVADFDKRINELPSVTQKSGKCKDCKYFEYDSVAKVDGVPLIVAHEICNKWGDGCKTREDGYCFLFEPQERSDKE